MDSISITKPNMALLSAEGGIKTGLSPFGLLSALFTAELERRVSQRIGEYRPLSLAFAEEGREEAPAPAAAPEIHYDLDVDLVLKLLRGEQNKQKEKEKREKKSESVGERIVERVILRERELHAVWPETRRVVIQGGSRSRELTLPLAGFEKPGTVSGGSAAKTGVVPAAVGARPDAGNAATVAAVRAADRTGAGAARAKERNHISVTRPVMASPLLRDGKTGEQAGQMLASRAAAVPAAGGWQPEERSMHPGYPVKRQLSGSAATPGAGSILLPDVLRAHRAAALERYERYGAVREEEELAGALEWSVEGTGRPSAERMVQEIRRAVDRTLRENAAQLTGRENPAEEPRKSVRGEQRAERPAEETRPAAAHPSREADKEAGAPRTAPPATFAAPHEKNGETLRNAAYVGEADELLYRADEGAAESVEKTAGVAADGERAGEQAIIAADRTEQRTPRTAWESVPAARQDETEQRTTTPEATALPVSETVAGRESSREESELDYRADANEAESAEKTAHTAPDGRRTEEPAIAAADRREQRTNQTARLPVSEAVPGRESAGEKNELHYRADANEAESAEKTARTAAEGRRPEEHTITAANRMEQRRPLTARQDETAQTTTRPEATALPVSEAIPGWENSKKESELHYRADENAAESIEKASHTAAEGRRTEEQTTTAADRTEQRTPRTARQDETAQTTTKPEATALPVSEAVPGWENSGKESELHCRADANEAESAEKASHTAAEGRRIEEQTITAADRREQSANQAARESVPATRQDETAQATTKPEATALPVSETVAGRESSREESELHYRADANEAESAEKATYTAAEGRRTGEQTITAADRTEQRTPQTARENETAQAATKPEATALPVSEAVPGWENSGEENELHYRADANEAENAEKASRTAAEGRRIEEQTATVSNQTEQRTPRTARQSVPATRQAETSQATTKPEATALPVSETAPRLEYSGEKNELHYRADANEAESAKKASHTAAEGRRTEEQTITAADRREHRTPQTARQSVPAARQDETAQATTKAEATALPVSETVRGREYSREENELHYRADANKAESAEKTTGPALEGRRTENQAITAADRTEQRTPLTARQDETARTTAKPEATALPVSEAVPGWENSGEENELHYRADANEAESAEKASHVAAEGRRPEEQTTTAADRTEQRMPQTARQDETAQATTRPEATALPVSETVPGWENSGEENELHYRADANAAESAEKTTGPALEGRRTENQAITAADRTEQRTPRTARQAETSRVTTKPEATALPVSEAVPGWENSGEENELHYRAGANATESIEKASHTAAEVRRAEEQTTTASNRTEQRTSQTARQDETARTTTRSEATALPVSEAVPGWEHSGEKNELHYRADANEAESAEKASHTVAEGRRIEEQTATVSNQTEQRTPRTARQSVPATRQDETAQATTKPEATALPVSETAPRLEYSGEENELHYRTDANEAESAEKASHTAAEGRRIEEQTATVPNQTEQRTPRTARQSVSTTRQDETAQATTKAEATALPVSETARGREYSREENELHYRADANEATETEENAASSPALLTAERNSAAVSEEPAGDKQKSDTTTKPRADGGRSVPETALPVSETVPGWEYSGEGNELHYRADANAAENAEKTTGPALERRRTENQAITAADRTKQRMARAAESMLPTGARPGRNAADSRAVRAERTGSGTTVRDIRILASALPVSEQAAGPGFGRIDMTLAQPPAAGRQEGAAPARPGESASDEAIKNLPAWARELLESPDGRVRPDTGAASVFGKGGAARSGQLSWSAPGYSGPSAAAAGGAAGRRGGGGDSFSAPAQLDLKRKEEQESEASRELHMKPLRDAELRKMADKVYRILEERLRRELRRSGK